MRISDWSSDVCSSDLLLAHVAEGCLIGQERPRDVYRHGHVPVVIGNILRIDVPLDSCRIDEPVDAAHRPCTALERRIDASAAGDVAMKVGGATWPRFVRSFGHLVAEIVEHVEAGHARAFPNKCTDDFRANSPATAGHNYTLVPHLHRLVILSGAASTA